MLAKTKPADLRSNLGKLHAVELSNLEFKKIRGEIHENSPGAIILPLRNKKLKQLNVIDWAATSERAIGYWIYTFVFGGLGLLTLYGVLWALMSPIGGSHEVLSLPFGAP